MATYYFANNGDDGATTNTIDTPWATVAKCNATNIGADGFALFKRGDTFTDAKLAPATSGTSGHPRTYGAYGTGAAPIINYATNGALSVGAKNYLTFDGIHFQRTVNDGNGCVAVGGESIGIVFQNCTIEAVAEGFLCYAASTDLSILNCVLAGTLTGDGIKFYNGVDHTNLTINGLTGSSKGLELQRVVSGSISNLTWSTVPYSPVHLFTTCHNIAASAINTTGTTATRTAIQLTGCYAMTFTDCTSTGVTGTLLSTTACHDISFIRCNSTLGQSAHRTGVDAAHYAIKYTDCIAYACVDDGFMTGSEANAGVHDVTYLRCIAIGNGNNATDSDGDGFTSHASCYNLKYLNCISAYNTASGFAMVGESSGEIINCVVWANSSVAGGATKVRGGLYLNLDNTQSHGGINPATGTTWKVRNCIIGQNVPMEMFLSGLAPAAALMDISHNCFYPLSDSALGKLDGTNVSSWATYSALEPHSINADPKLINPANSLTNDYRVALGSMATGTGESGFDIGAFKVSSGVRRIGGGVGIG